jgi:hypothetical protein
MSSLTVRAEKTLPAGKSFSAAPLGPMSGSISIDANLNRPGEIRRRSREL